MADLITRAARGWRRSGREQRAFGGTFGDSSIMPNSVMMGQGSSGLVLTEAGVLSIQTALNCVRVLFDDTRLLGFGAYTGVKTGAKRMIPEQPLIVRQPWGPDEPRTLGFAKMMASVKLRGTAYIRVLDEDRDGFPTLLRVLHPDMVRPFIDPRSGQKKWDVRNDNGTMETLLRAEMRQVDGVMMPGSIHGIDPISYQRITLGEAADVAQYGANYFRNGSNHSGVISVPGSGSRRKAREIRDQFEAAHSGVFNSHRPAVMFGGATWQPMTISNENAQFLQTRQFLREEIAGWFGVPLERLQIQQEKASRGGGAGMQTKNEEYALYTIGTWCTPVEELWDTFIPGDDRTWSMFDLRALLRASPMTRAQIRQIDRLTGVRNSNEGRAEEGWEPYEGGDDYAQPFNTAASMNSPSGTGGDGGDGNNNGAGQTGNIGG